MFSVKNQDRASGFPPDALPVFCAYNTLVNWTIIRRVSGLLLLVVSLVALTWSLWPLSVRTRSLIISPAEMRPEDLPAGQALADLPAISAPRTLLLEWPPLMRMGELALLRLTFNPALQEGASPEISSETSGEYFTLAEARLELPAVAHTPPGQVSQALLPGEPVTFIWELLPSRAGEAEGTVWLHLRFVPTAGGSELRRLLTAQRVQIRAISFLGLSGPWARALGSAGAAMGAALGLDGVALYLWRHIPRRSGVSQC